MPERLGIAGAGAIACGLARLAHPLGEVVLWARSEASAGRARSEVGSGPEVVTELAELGRCTFVVEAVVEEQLAKVDLYGRLGEVLADDAVLTSSTSSLPISELAAAGHHPERFAGFHVFNPVERMPLVEVCFPPAASADTRARVSALCAALGKTPVEVPDRRGFVVNRLLFPYLFDAVRLLEDGGLEPAALDTCMRLGAGHPMGPLALLDLVGIDVSVSIGESLGLSVPRALRTMAAEGRLGRKAGAGFFDYPRG